jgi:hypothetical protein
MGPVVVGLIVAGLLVVLAAGSTLFRRKTEEVGFAPLISRKAA